MTRVLCKLHMIVLYLFLHAAFYVNAASEQQQLLDWSNKNPIVLLGADEAMPPYSYVNPQGQPDGFSQDVLKLLNIRLPFELKTQKNASFNILFQDVAAGKLAGLSMCSAAVDRQSEFFFTTPVLTITPILVTQVSKEVVLNDAKLPDGFTLSATHADISMQYASLLTDGANITATNDVEEGLNLVAEGKIDGFVSFLGVINYFEKKSNISNLAKKPLNSLPPVSLGFCISKDKPELRDWLNKAIDNIDPKELQDLEIYWATRDYKMVDKGFEYSFALQILIAAIIFVFLIAFITSGRHVDQLAKSFSTFKFKAIFLLIIFLISGSLYFSLDKWLGELRASTEANISDKLFVNQENTLLKLDAWLQRRYPAIQKIANSREFIIEVEELLKENQLESELTLSDSQQLSAIIYSQLGINYPHLGYEVVATTGYVVASEDIGLVGNMSSMVEKRPIFFGKLLEGHVELVPAIRETNSFGKQQILMHLAAPIFNKNGEVIAAFAIKIAAKDEFSQAFQTSGLGDSGDSYVADSLGRLVSASSRSKELIDQGVLEVGETTILTQSLSDESTKGVVDSAQYGLSGENLNGYINYRGEKVIGKWQWLSHLNLLLVSEMSNEEAFRDYYQARNFLRWSFVAVITCLLLIAVFLIRIGQRAYSLLNSNQEQLEQLVENKTKELKQSEQKNKSILGSVDDAIISFDLESRCTYVNQAALELLGYEKAELLQQPILTKIYSDERMQNSEEMISNLLAQQAGVRKNSEFCTRDSGAVPVEYALTQLTEDNEVIGGVVVFRDISSQQKAEQALVEAKRVSDEANQTKSDFLANVSHEIRTPINAVIGMSGLALQHDMSSKAKNYLHKANRAAQSLLGIIDDILDFSKIDSGHLDIKAVDFHLEDVMANLASIIGLKAHERSLELLFDIAPNVPLNLHGDPQRINQVLVNIAGNATKFTEHGQVVVRVKLVAENSGQYQLQFAVEDSGIGMNEDQVSKIFDSFAQGDSSSTRKYGGTGLGLVISQQLISLMGGKLQVESEVGKGSTFSFSLTLESGKETSEPIPPPSDNFFAGKNVLIVDDNEIAVDILANIMVSFGCIVTKATNGLEAIAVAQDNEASFDFILVDWKMPGLDGVETCRKLKAVAKSESSYFIMVTAFGREEIASGSLGSEVDSLLTKPVTASIIYDEMLRIFKTELTPSSPTYSSSWQKSQQQLAGAKILLVEDNELNQELALELLHQAGMSTELAENGQQAIDKALSQHFDGILMDIQMPVMDGYTATSIIRQSLPELPIIALTANAMTQDKEKALSVGMNDHVAKPINVELLMTTMAMWIEPSESNQPIHSLAIEELKATNNTDLLEVDAEHLNTARGIKTCNHDKALYMRLLSKFSEGQSDFAQQFSEAFSEHLLEDATRIAHSLKGVAGNIGAISLYEYTKELEQACRDEVPSEVINTHFQQTVKELSVVLELIIPLVDSEPDVKVENVQGTKISSQDLFDALTELNEMLVEFDSDSIELAEEIHESMQDISDKSRFKDVLKLIENYDFEAASEKLVALYPELNG